MELSQTFKLLNVFKWFQQVGEHRKEDKNHGILLVPLLVKLLCTVHTKVDQGIFCKNVYLYKQYVDRNHIVDVFAVCRSMVGLVNVQGSHV